MNGSVDMTSVKEGGTFILAEKGIQKVQIVEVAEKYSKASDPMPRIKMEVVSGPSQGAVIWDNILIPKPDSTAVKILGKTKHFFHILGEPFEDMVTWDTTRWEYKRFYVRVGHEEPNEYHKNTKAVVDAYLHDEDVAKEDKENSIEECPI